MGKRLERARFLPIGITPKLANALIGPSSQQMLAPHASAVTKHLGKCGDASCGCMCMKPVYVSQEYREALAAKGIEIEGFPAAGSEEPKLRIEAEAYGNLSGNTCCGWCNAKLHGKPIYTMPTAISDCRVLVCEKCASKRAAPVASQAPAPKKEFTEDQRLDFVWKAVAEHVGGVPNDNLGYIGTYSGMVADYALRRIDEMENQLFEMTKLCHQYQDQLWTEAKKAQAEANHE